MHEVIEIYEANPTQRSVKLEMKNLKDITQIAVLLSKFKHLQDLSLHGNKITYLPLLDNLKHLHSLDISNNPIKIDGPLLDRLYQIPHLQSLSISATKDQCNAIIQNLPNLKALNHQPITRQIVRRNSLKEELQVMCKKLQEEMKRIKETYNKLASTLQDMGNESVMSKEEQFNFMYQEIQEEMCYFYTGLQDELSREGVYVYSKNKLMMVMDNLLLRALDEVGNDSVVKIYEQVTRMKNQNFDELLRIIFKTSYEKYIDNKVQSPNNRLRKEAIYQNQIFRLKKQNLETKKEQQKMQQLIQKQNQLVQQIQKIKTPRKLPLNPQSFSKSPSATNLSKKSPNKSLTKIQTAKGSLSRSPSIKKTTPIKNQANGKGSTIRSAAQGSRICSLQQLLELIGEIMIDKRKYNERNLQKGEPYETAEQFIFTFFSRRYGLKDIALDWALSVIKAIEVYCKQSIEVEVFGKILKSQLYEQYYDECLSFGKQIQRSCQEPRHKKTVTENEFQRIFYYYFSYEDPQTLEKILTNFHFPIGVNEMVYFLQSYKLAFEEKHLKKFIEVFTRCDGDEDSALTAQECKQLIAKLIDQNEQLTEHEKPQQKSLLVSQMSGRRKDKFIFSEVFQLIHKII